MPRLGVNIDHIATLREVRKTTYPDPTGSLPILCECGVDQVTCHVREDRRHMQEDDLAHLMSDGRLPVNLEMAVTPAMLDLACKYKPTRGTFVPEKRQEITTEGGLDLTHHEEALFQAILRLHEQKIKVSLFIDPDEHQIKQAKHLGADGIELHTGTYCDAFGTDREDQEWSRLNKAARLATQLGMPVFAGHGLNIKNLPLIVSIQEIKEYNIGHSIIARAVFVGLKNAILEIKNILNRS